MDIASVEWAMILIMEPPFGDHKLKGGLLSYL